FGQIELDFSQRLAGRRRRVHLIRAPVAAFGRALGCFTEWAIKAAGIFGGVAEDRHVLKAAAVERLANRADHAVHHAAGRDDVGAGPRVTQGLLTEQLQRGVIVYTGATRAVIDHTAVPVVGVF